MKKFDSCVCGERNIDNGLCESCRALIRAKRSKKIAVVEKFRADYNRQKGTYKSYGHFVLLLDMIDRRKREIDNRGEKATAAKIRRNRR